MSENFFALLESLLLCEQERLVKEGYYLQSEGLPADQVDDQILRNARRMMRLRRLMAN
jgi:hypothetical protein